MADQISGRRILIFDSGLGGLTVLAEIVRRVPAADLVYVADDAGFPYGGWDEAALVQHVVALIGDFIVGHQPDLVVIACNTASTLVLPPLRAAFELPFVGTVPAIKLAATQSKSGLISVLATPGTVARDYTRNLIVTFAGDAEITLVGSSRLAPLAENWLWGQAGLDDEIIRTEIEPCFRMRGAARTDTIVLGCTHYPLLLDRFQALSPWDVDWIDGAAAIARRVRDLLPADSAQACCQSSKFGPTGRIVFTSGARPSQGLRSRLSAFGLTA